MPTNHERPANPAEFDDAYYRARAAADHAEAVARHAAAAARERSRPPFVRHAEGKRVAVHVHAERTANVRLDVEALVTLPHADSHVEISLDLDGPLRRGPDTEFALKASAAMLGVGTHVIRTRFHARVAPPPDPTRGERGVDADVWQFGRGDHVVETVVRCEHGAVVDGVSVTVLPELPDQNE